MTEPVPPISGAYPPPAIVSRKVEVRSSQAAEPRLAPFVAATISRAAPQLPGIALAGPGWVPVLHGYPRRGLRADEAERRRYRSSYAGSNAAPGPAPRMERRA